MYDLDKEIRRLAGEIRAVEEMLVEVYGLTPVTPAVAADFGSAWVHRLRALYHSARRPLASFMESGDILSVRAPQPD